MQRNGNQNRPAARSAHHARPTASAAVPAARGRPVVYSAEMEERAARRAQQRRKRRHRRLCIFYCVMFLLVVAAAVTLSLTVLFHIDSISVAGTSRYSSEQIIEASGITVGDNLFQIKTGEASGKIQAALPYIGTVKVSRRFPASVVITVADETVAGAVSWNGKYVIVGSSGRTLEIADSIPQGAVNITGLEVTQADAGQPVAYADSSSGDLLLTVIQTFLNDDLEDITSLDFSNTSKILAVYQDRVTINLGSEAGLDYKVRFAKKLLDTEIGQAERGTLDMSITPDTDKAYFDPDYSYASSAG